MDNLQVRRTAAKFVPRLKTSGRKQNRVVDDPVFVNYIIMLCMVMTRLRNFNRLDRRQNFRSGHKKTGKFDQTSRQCRLSFSLWICIQRSNRLVFYTEVLNRLFGFDAMWQSCVDPCSSIDPWMFGGNQKSPWRFRPISKTRNCVQSTTISWCRRDGRRECFEGD